MTEDSDDFARAERALEREELETALPMLRRLAEAGSAEAQHSLFWCYSRGSHGVPVDESAAEYWLKKLTETAEGGNLEAQKTLWSHYFWQDDAAAQEEYWRLMAAENGSANAQHATWDELREKSPEKAAPWLAKALAQEYPETLWKHSFSLYEGCEPNEEALRLVKRAAEQGHALAKEYLGYVEKGLDAERDYICAERAWEDGEWDDGAKEKALSMFRRLAEAGHADAQWKLLRSYSHGYGVPEDESVADYWFDKLAETAEGGDVKAQEHMWDCYVPGEHADYWRLRAAENGCGRAQHDLWLEYDRRKDSPEKAAYWLQKALEQEYPETLWTYAISLGKPYDPPEEALRLIRRAAELGLPPAREYFEFFDNPPQRHRDYVSAMRAWDAGDAERALPWLKRLAEAGSANAQYQLFIIHASGERLPVDEAAAEYWMTKLVEAADAGNFTAEVNLRDIFRHPPERARYWLLKAAEKGIAFAQHELWDQHRYGSETFEKSLETAAYWFERAREQNYPKALQTLQSYANSLEQEDVPTEEALYLVTRAAEKGLPLAKDALERYTKKQAAPSA